MLQARTQVTQAGAREHGRESGRRMELVQIPFRGDQNYINGADLVIDALSKSAANGSNIRFAGYSMLRSSALLRTKSSTPLSPKEFDAIVRVDTANGTTDIGYQVSKTPGKTRVACYDSEFQTFVQTGELSAQISNPMDERTTLLSLLVLTIKMASQIGFPKRKGKWIFARCVIQSLPPKWQQGKVWTDASADARFFNWQVTIDGTKIGSIVFFNVEEPT